ncbi:MAG TPA: TolC family protein [Tepidisphaeraceae bacterium]|nr:TolC family protein [Tepidisphaeraceae bacterium]
MNNRLAICLALFSTLSIACDPYGGAVMVPPQKLHDIQGLDLSANASTQPTTQASTQPTTEPAEKVTITLAEVRQMALHNNLDLKVELLNPTISKAGLSQEEAQFESTFDTSASYSVSDSPSNDPSRNVILGSGFNSTSVSPGITVPLRTGGSIQVDLPMSRVQSNDSDPTYTTSLSASISQPLLRGAGIETSTHRMRIAAYDYQISQAQAKLEVIRVLADADRAYWRLYAARQDLDVRKKQYDLSVSQLDRAKRQVEHGLAAEVEIIRAESGVADNVEAVIVAENAVRDRQRELKRIINQTGLEMGTPTILVPASLPRPLEYKFDPDKVVKTALSQRMEMLELEFQILQQASSVAFAKQDLLPLVSMNYRYRVNGLGPTLDDSFQLLNDKRFEDHSVGLQIQVPLGNEAAKARLRQALAGRMQRLMTKEQRSLAIQQEVYNALDTIQADWQRILASEKRTILNSRLLEAEIRQFDLGLRTSTDVLNAQTALADAQSSEISALTDYQIAQVDLAFATGMLLGASGVSWDPTPAPRQ